MSTQRVICCVVGRGCLLWPVHSLGKTLLAIALLHFVLQNQTCLLLQVPLHFLHLHSSWWKGHLFLVLVLEGLANLSTCKPFIFSFFGISGWCIDLDYCDIEWFSLEMNRDHSVIFGLARIWSGLPFPSPGDHVLSELSIHHDPSVMTHQ